MTLFKSNSAKDSIFPSFSLPALFVFLCLNLPSLTAQDLDVPYVPTPQNVVDQMIEIANVKPSDYVIDLGSGDGRIVITAAKHGAIGHGVDLDPERISEARANAQKAGVADQVMFIQQDLFETDFSRASVITMYLLPSINKELRPILLEKLEPGTRIVSHDFDMGEWRPDIHKTVKNSSGAGTHEIFYWVIPAKVAGKWSFSANDNDFTMDISQKYQQINVVLTDEDGTSYKIDKAELHGPRLRIRAVDDNGHYIFSGRVEGDKVTGIIQHHNAKNKEFLMWSAKRE